MPDPAKSNPLKLLFAPFASLKLTVTLLAFSLVLIYAGTWAQIDNGIWQVQKKYFHSFLYWLDPALFFPRNANGRSNRSSFSRSAASRSTSRSRCPAGTRSACCC